MRRLVAFLGESLLGGQESFKETIENLYQKVPKLSSVDEFLIKVVGEEAIRIITRGHEETILTEKHIEKYFL
jgi:hypothetical protein